MTDPDIKERLTIAIKSMLDKKAVNVMILDVSKSSSFTDYIVTCSGSSDTHVKAVAGSIDQSLKKERILPLGIEGFSVGQWVLMDYGDIVINIFYEPVRDFYDLEGLWSEVPRFEASEPFNFPF
ncbi:MAG: ribosome silencing factor [Thermodesulfobacteriota bacterium]